MPVEEFRNNKFFTQNIKYPGINKIKLTKSKKNKKLSVITTGTSLSKCLNAINSLDVNHISKIDLYSFSDLSMCLETEKIQQLKSNNFLLVDDSPGEFGICSELELILRRKMSKNNIKIKLYLDYQILLLLIKKKRIELDQQKKLKINLLKC